MNCIIHYISAHMSINTVLVSYFTGYLVDKINLLVQRYVIGKLWKTTK